MGWMDEKYPMWFVYDYYIVAGRPKAEDAVMRYACDKYLYRLIAEEILEDVQMDLERYCMKIREENKRLAPVKIQITDRRYREDGLAWLKIGEQNLRLRRVKETIE